MTKLKVGVLSTRNPEFLVNTNLDELFEKTMSDLKKLAEELDFDLYIAKTMVEDDDSAFAATKECNDQDVDFLLLQLTSCPGNGGTWIPIIAETTTAKLGLWSLPEGTVDGPSPINSFIGMTFYAGIIGRYIKSCDYKVKWFHGYVNDKYFKDRFTVTVKALTALKKMNESKIGLVGGVARGFGDLYFDERNAHKILPGLEMYTHCEYYEIRDKALSYGETEVKAAIESYKKAACSMVQGFDDKLDITARFYLAYKEFIEKNGFDALALNCTYNMGAEFGIELCSIIAKLGDEGYTISCEGDFMGGISMLLLKYLAGEEPSLTDFPNWDDEDDSVLMWHCGASPCNMACDGCRDWTKGYGGAPFVSDLRFRKDKMTIARISGEADSMFIAYGETITDKPVFLGSGGWIGNLKLNDEKIKAADFVNTILANKFHHHYPLVMGDYHKELAEIAGWLSLKSIPKIEYKDYFQNKTWEA